MYRGRAGRPGPARRSARRRRAKRAPSGCAAIKANGYTPPIGMAPATGASGQWLNAERHGEDQLITAHLGSAAAYGWSPSRTCRPGLAGTRPRRATYVSAVLERGWPRSRARVPRPSRTAFVPGRSAINRGARSVPPPGYRLRRPAHGLDPAGLATVLAKRRSRRRIRPLALGLF